MTSSNDLKKSKKTYLEEWDLKDGYMRGQEFLNHAMLLYSLVSFWSIDSMTNLRSIVMRDLLVLQESLRLDCFLKDLYYSSRKFGCNIQVGHPLQSNPYTPSRLVEEGNFRLVMYDIRPKISNQPNCPNK